MTLQLFGHPFSSYTWKALIALYENDTAFTFRQLGPDQADNGAEFARRWPIGKFPLLVDGDTQVMEASAIIEYLEALHPGPVRLIPDAPRAAVHTRMMDRIFDNYVMGAMQVPVIDSLRDAEHRDPYGVAAARTGLTQIYAWLDGALAGQAWGAGDSFSLADCAAAPSLFYADWVEPIPPEHGVLRAYRARLLARPSVARAVDEARPYRAYFPLGAPDRD